MEFLDETRREWTLGQAARDGFAGIGFGHQLAEKMQGAGFNAKKMPGFATNLQWILQGKMSRTSSASRL